MKNSAPKILVIRLDEIGDFVLTTPFLRELKRCYPDSVIDMIVKPAVYNLAETCPYLNKIYTAEPAHRKVWKNTGLFFELFRKRLTSYYDMALLPRIGPDGSISRKLAFVSGAKRRIVFKQSLSRRDAFLINETIDSPEPEHSVLKNFKMLEYLGFKYETGRLELRLTDDDIAFAENIISKTALKHDFIVALSTGSLRAHALWPIERYVELIRWLSKICNTGFVLLGDSSDMENASYILQNCKDVHILDMTGKTTLRQTLALLKYCKLYLGNDTSVVHLSSVMKVPTLVLSAHSASDTGFMSTSIRFHPWGVKYRIVQPDKSIPPCVSSCIAKEPHCILQVNVEDVRNAVLEMITKIL